MTVTVASLVRFETKVLPCFDWKCGRTRARHISIAPSLRRQALQLASKSERRKLNPELQEHTLTSIEIADNIAMLLDVVPHLPLPPLSALPTVTLAALDPSMKYAFMLPTATAVATSCQLAGIGGAALFAPIFLLGFPLLGPEYPLDSAAASIASALLTEVFGFSSGLTGYAPRGLRFLVRPRR